VGSVTLIIETFLHL